MALCDPCYDLFRIFEGHRNPEVQPHEDVFSFRDWLSAQDDQHSVSRTLPQLPGLIHSSWKSFCKSLDSFCPVCWMVWRHIRDSPTTSYRDQVRQEFVLFLYYGRHLTHVSGAISLRCLTDIKDWDFLEFHFKRATKQRFEEVVAKTPLEDHMGSSTTVETVKNWLSMCDTGHGSGGDGCVAKRRAVNSPTIPTRLIDLHSSDSQSWSLIETENYDKFRKYVALSHRWTADTPRLLNSNYLAFQTNQEDKVLPRSYQDVFALCRRLDIQYVWIDSLCIFQDSKEDFLHEAGTMTEVYANAFCTFSICWESPYGFLRPRDHRELARWDTWDPDSGVLPGQHMFVQDQWELQMAIDQTPVNQRGWVFQEQLLSPRVLYVGNDQFYWQCDNTRSCETAPIGINTAKADYKRKNIAHEHRNHAIWQELVVQFMRLDLTFERDRLLAISGIARFLLSPTKEALLEGRNSESYQGKEEKTMEYVAGLQRVHWIEDLLWSPTFEPSRPGSINHRLKLDLELFNRQPDDTVPSWSWASCPGPIQWRLEHDAPWREHVKEVPMACLRNINFEPLGSDVYGLPKSASLEISCLLVQARYDDRSGFEQGVKGPVDQASFHQYSDSFLLPLPYPRMHSDEQSVLTVALESYENFVPTCFLIPLVDMWTSPGRSRLKGLVVQKTPQSDGMREFVRIGSFGKGYGGGAAEMWPAILKNVPAAGDEFEQRVRDSARAWNEAKSRDPRNKDKGTAKAEWATIRLV